MFEKKIKRQYSVLVSFYQTDKEMRVNLLASTYKEILTDLSKRLKNDDNIEKIVIREASGFDGRGYLMEYCPDCGKLLTLYNEEDE